MQFIGRRDWLARFTEKRDAEQGGIWNIVGQPGIGKTTLLAEFAQRCEALEHPHTRLDVGNYAPTNGLDVLTELARAARHFDAEAGGKSFYEKFNDAYQRHKETLSGAAELAAKVIDPTGVIGGVVKSATSLSSSLAGSAAKSAKQDAAAHPERYLVEALAAAGKNKPVLLVDTWEHLMRPDARLQTRLRFGFGEPSEATERNEALARWLHDLFTYLASQGWRIVVAGREIPGATADDRLPRFTRAEILEAARNRPNLVPALAEQQDDIAAILATLSFEGNPLWLQVALNLLENLLAEGKDPAQLARDPDALQRCFEEDDPFDTGKYEGIEHGRCKLALLGTLTRHIEGIEDHAWKIALPRVLDKGIVAQLFPPEQARAILHNFQIAGVFRKSGEQFSLHEEIRDLLLAYARDHDFLDNAETQELHEKLWVYLNDLYLGKLPPTLRTVVSREGIDSITKEERDEIEKQIAQYIPLGWMLEATYHRVIGSAILREMEMVPEVFWEKLAGSLSLSNLEKWRVAEQMLDLETTQIVTLLKVWDYETGKMEKVLLEHEHVDPQSYQAWRKQSVREGGGDIHAMFSDVPFWQRRLDQAPTPRNLYCLARALGRCERWKEEVSAWDKLVAQYGESGNPEILAQCAKALVNKGVTLGNRLDDPRGAVAAYDDLLASYGESDNPEIQVQCAKALFNQGVTLGNRLDDPRGAVAAYDDLLTRYGDSDNPEIQVQCAKALYNKGWTLGNRLDDPRGEVAAYDDLLTRYGESDNPDIQVQCAKALYNKGWTLGNRLDDPRGEVAIYDDLLAHYGELDNPEIQALCAMALFQKGETLGNRLNDPRDAVVAYDDLLAHFGKVDTPEIQKLCAMALFQKGVTLGNRLDGLHGAVAAYADLLTRYGESDKQEIQELCAMALFQKGVTLGNRFDDLHGAVAAYADLLMRYGESDKQEIQVLCAMALFQKGVTLGNRLNDPRGEVATYDDLLTRYSESDNPEIQEQCAKAQVNKGWTLGNRLDDPQGEVATYDDLLTRYGESDNPEIQVQCAKALFNQGVTLGNRLDDPRGAVAIYDDLLTRFGESDNPEIQIQCAKALVNKGVTLGNCLDDPRGAVAAYDDLLTRYGESDNPEIQVLCANALVNKSGTLERLNDLRGVVAVCDALLAGYGESDNPEIQEHCLSALENSVEWMLILGEPDEAVRRAELALARLEASAPKAAIMVFLRWLARGEAAPDEVLAAIRALPEEPEFGWGWDGIRPLVAGLPASRRCRAECFIAYFETHRDVVRLHGCLAVCGTTASGLST